MSIGILRRLAVVATLTGVAQATVAQEPVLLPKDLPREIQVERWRSDNSHFETIGDVELHYKDEGAGPAVLLIHGSVQDLYDWDGWATVLKSKFRVVRLDLPGFGLSGPVASGDYTIVHTMEIIDALMDKLGIETFGLVGTSYGGVVTFRYAATRPEKVAALILMSSAGVEWGNEKIIPPQERRYQDTYDDYVSPKQVETILTAVVHDPSVVTQERIDRAVDSSRRAGRQQEGISIAESYERGKPDDVLAQIVSPTLVLWGAENRALPTPVADEFVSLLTNAPAEKELIPGTAHWPHFEQPIESGKYALRFFEKVLNGKNDWRITVGGDQ